MIAIATSLLFGLAACMALVVVWLSVRSGVALGMALLAEPERSGAGIRHRPRSPARRGRAAIFPAARDRATAAPSLWPRHAAA